MAKCIIDNKDLLPVIDLGSHYVSDFVEKDEIELRDKSSLQIGLGQQSGLAQLMEAYPSEKMYKKYWYRSCVNESMRRALQDVVDSTRRYVRLNTGDIVLDIASNDGTLLTSWSDNYIRIGIDPSDVALVSPIYGAHNIKLVNDFFSEAAYKNIYNIPAKVITIIAMFYDIAEPIKFLHEVSNCMADDGLLVIQCSYTPLMLQQNAFENICHEHLAYYSLFSIKQAVDQARLNIIDVELNDVNAGSFRVYITKRMSPNKMYAPKHTYDVGKYRVRSLLEYEKTLQLDTPQPYIEFMERIDSLKEQTIQWLIKQKEDNKKVIGYGASTKGNTLLQYYGITSELLPFIAERSESKYGLYTVGSGIPIISEDEMRAMKPDYLLAFPWQFINSFREREQGLMQQGTKFVVPLPELAVYDR